MVNDGRTDIVYPDTNGPQAAPPICRSIVTGHLVVLRYGGGQRLVEPMIHGYSGTGVELLCGYQRDGSSASGVYAGWKTFLVSEIEDLAVLNVVMFDEWRPIRHWPPRGITTLHCSE